MHPNLFLLVSLNIPQELRLKVYLKKKLFIRFFLKVVLSVVRDLIAEPFKSYAQKMYFAETKYHTWLYRYL